MTTSISIRKSWDSLFATIVAQAVGAALIILLVWLIIETVFSWAPEFKRFLTQLSALILLGAWVIAALMAWMRWRSTSYELNDKAIIVHSKALLVGTNQREYYFSALGGAQVRQTPLSRFGDFGSIVLSDNNGQQLLTLDAVVKPQVVLQQIHLKMEKR